MDRKFWQRLAVTTIVLGVTALIALPAKAQTQFADFSISGGSPFIYDNASGTFSATTTGVLNFQNLDMSSSPYASAVGGIAANFQLTAQTLGNTLDTNNSIGVYGLTLKIIDNDSRFGQIGKNLLSVELAPGNVSQGTLHFDANNVNVGSLLADSSTDNVTFSSDFLAFSGDQTIVRSFNLGMSSIDQTGNPDTTLGFAPDANGRPVSFNSGGGINFSATQVPIVAPEANAGLLMGIATPLLGGLALARRKR